MGRKWEGSGRKVGGKGRKRKEMEGKVRGKGGLHKRQRAGLVLGGGAEEVGAVQVLSVFKIV